MATALAPHIGSVLGGPDVIGRIESEFDLVDAVQNGIPVAALDDIIARDLLSASEIDTLVLPRRTLSHRRATDGRLTLDESDRLARVARVLALAAECFGDPETAARWLRQSQYGLREQAPLTLLITTEGARLVEDELTRIAAGDLA